jgi:hypothetical protein
MLELHAVPGVAGVDPVGVPVPVQLDVEPDRERLARLDPGDVLSVAKHRYEVQYSPVDLGATGPPPSDEEKISEILGRSLLERAGLDRRTGEKASRYNVLDDREGQIRDPNKPT